MLRGQRSLIGLIYLQLVLDASTANQDSNIIDQGSAGHLGLIVLIIINYAATSITVVVTMRGLEYVF